MLCVGQQPERLKIQCKKTDHELLRNSTRMGQLDVDGFMVSRSAKAQEWKSLIAPKLVAEHPVRSPN